MSQLERSIRTSVKTSTSITATIVDVLNNKASVRLLRNGALMHNLDVIGGPVIVGQKVKVDFTTAKPTVVAPGQAGLSEADILGLLKRSGTGTSGGIGGGGGIAEKIMIILFEGGQEIARFQPDLTGLLAAFTASAAGDNIWLPDVDITGDITMTAGVTLSGTSTKQSILRGTITLADGCSLETLQVRQHLNDATNSIAIQAMATGTATIRNCEVHAYNCGSGNCISVDLPDGDEKIIVDQCTVIADTSGGSGYCFSDPYTTTKLEVTHCNLFAKTAEYYEG